LNGSLVGKRHTPKKNANWNLPLTEVREEGPRGWCHQKKKRRKKRGGGLHSTDFCQKTGGSGVERGWFGLFRRFLKSSGQARWGTVKNTVQ